MEDEWALGIRNWGYYDLPVRSNLGLQFIPSPASEREPNPKNHLSSSGCLLSKSDPEPSAPTEYDPGEWFHQKENMLHAFPFSHMNYMPINDPPTIQISQSPNLSREAANPQIDVGIDSTSKKKRKKKSKMPNLGRASSKVSKPRKPKKLPAPPKAETGDTGSIPRGKARWKNTALVINGIDLDISDISTPVCTCTGEAQQCYRWGMGGWQSACCTNNLSTYPLPMSTKRRGARIAGRKMSHGAFKKVLEKLTNEGYDLSNPIDLRGYWAKHGTNKFVTIR